MPQDLQFDEWLIFGVAMSVVPIVTSATYRVVRFERNILEKTIGRGELQLISMPIGMASVGHLFISGATASEQANRFVFVGITLVLVFMSAILCFMLGMDQEKEPSAAAPKKSATDGTGQDAEAELKDGAPMLEVTEQTNDGPADQHVAPKPPLRKSGTQEQIGIRKVVCSLILFASLIIVSGKCIYKCDFAAKAVSASAVTTAQTGYKLHEANR